MTETPTETPTERYLLSALVEQASALSGIAKELEGAGAKIVKTEELGERRLAFTINKHSSLQLVSIFFEAGKEMIRETEKNLRGNNNIQRFLLTKWAADPNEASSRRGRGRTEAEGEQANV